MGEQQPQLMWLLNFSMGVLPHLPGTPMRSVCCCGELVAFSGYTCGCAPALLLLACLFWGFQATWAKFKCQTSASTSCLVPPLRTLFAGRLPYAGLPHLHLNHVRDAHLRPVFHGRCPGRYAQLALRCMSADPGSRWVQAMEC